MEKRTYKYTPKCFEGKYDGYIEMTVEKNIERQKRALNMGALMTSSMTDEEKSQLNAKLLFDGYEIAKSLIVSVSAKRLGAIGVEITTIDELEYDPALIDLIAELSRIAFNGFPLGNE